MKIKSLLHNKSYQIVIAFIIVSYIKLVRITSKTNCINLENLEQAKKNSNNLIFAFWHGRMLMLTSYLQHEGQIVSIVSGHDDGNLVDITLKLFRSKTLRGSSSKGGQTVLRKILKELKKNNTHLCITPDGPRGPRMEVTSAVIDIAKISGATIVPVTFGAKKVRLLNSWDLFMIPRLFNRITLKFGSTIKIDRYASQKDIEIAKIALENSLNQMTWEIDKSYGQTKIKPGKVKEKKNKNP